MFTFVCDSDRATLKFGLVQLHITATFTTYLQSFLCCVHCGTSFLLKRSGTREANSAGFLHVPLTHLLTFYILYYNYYSPTNQTDYWLCCAGCVTENVIDYIYLFTYTHILLGFVLVQIMRIMFRMFQ